MSEILIGRINTKLKHRKYIQELTKRIQVDRVVEVKVGDIVTFALLIDKDYTLSCVGKKPEKYSVEDDVLTIVMTDCGLVYLYNDGGRKKLGVVVAR